VRGAESSSSTGGVCCWFGGLLKPIAEVRGVIPVMPGKETGS